MQKLIASFLVAGNGLFVVMANSDAQTISIPHTFTAGTAAKAADVNDNFSALTTAINALTARVAALEAPLSPPAILGSYIFSRFSVARGYSAGTGIPAATGTNDTASLNSAAVTGTLTLTSDGNFAIASSGQSVGLSWNGGWLAAGNNLQLTTGAVYSPLGSANGPITYSDGGTWTFSAGTLVLTTSNGQVLNFSTPTSRIFIHIGSLPGQTEVILLSRNG